MTTFTKPIFCGDMVGKLTQFTSANGMTLADITTADPNGPVRIDSLSVFNYDTAAASLNVNMSDGTQNYWFGTIDVASWTHVNILTSTGLSPLIGHDAAGNAFLELPKGWKLQAALAAMPSNGKDVNVQARWGTYAGA